jgi:nucleotidyltransferase substrate binding protein (TIGR01987 family)
MNDDIKKRWVYRFDNYKRAFLLLREAIESMDERELNQLEKEGTIQRFEYTWELSWKVLKDYLEVKGVTLETVTPASTVRAALEAKIIRDGDVWMRALDARNKMAHTYDFSTFEETINKIQMEFLHVFQELYEFMLEHSLVE